MKLKFRTRKKESTTMSKNVVVGKMQASVTIKKDSCAPSPSERCTLVICTQFVFTRLSFDKDCAKKIKMGT